MVKLKLLNKESKRKKLKTFFFFKKKVKESGIVEFSNDCFIISYKRSKYKVDLKTISEINIMSDYYQGRVAPAFQKNHSSTNFHSGIMKIEFMDEGKIGKHFNVIIENKNEFNVLVSIIKCWYLDFNNLLIKEYNPFKSDRKLLLEDLFDYNRIQILKKELGIDSIYS